jgi:phosphoglycolate phosphatase-like HAD superfamily hydrolase
MEGVPVAGRLDPLILADAFAISGVPDTHEHRHLVRAAYAKRLEETLDASHGAVALPGVPELLEALRPVAERGDAVLALLTGNFEETGVLKLRRCGIDPSQFRIGVFGDHAATVPPRREDLVPVGVERASKVRGRSVSKGEVVVIGDTPHDVRCATAHGGWSLAVATGRSSVAELAGAGAHRAVEDLRDTNDILAWLLEPRVVEFQDPSRPG